VVSIWRELIASRRRIDNKAKRSCFDEAYSQRRLVMQKTALTIFGALLISGFAVQIATASERHSHFRRAYNQVTGPVEAAPVVRYYNWDAYGFGFGGRDPSQVGGQDPSLRPSGS
jgi:hypothetical protein